MGVPTEKSSARLVYVRRRYPTAIASSMTLRATKLPCACEAAVT